MKRLLTMIVFLSFAAVANAADPPKITRVDGIWQTGQVLSITGSNLMLEDKTNWQSKFKTGNTYSFEGTSLDNDGITNHSSNVSYSSSVKLMGSQSAKFHLSGASSPAPGYGESVAVIPQSAGDNYYRAYVKYDNTSGIWPDNVLKMFLINGPACGLYIQPQSGRFGDPYGKLASYTVTDGKWHVIEMRYKSTSPAAVSLWVDNTLLFTETQADTSAALACSIISWEFGAPNFFSTPSNFAMDIYVDGLTVSSSRVNPASVIEISNNPTYGAGTVKYQEPVYLSDNSVQFKADLSGLGSGPYYLWVTNNQLGRNIDGYNPSGAQSSDPDTQTPTTPTTLAASAVSSSQINLTWVASSDNTAVTGYKIYRGGTYLATVTGTSYSNTGLSASTSYAYTVSAIDAAGNESSQSSSVSATTLAAVIADSTPPSIPSGCSANAASSSQINFSWTASTDNVGVTGYKIYRGGAYLATSTTTSYADTGLSASTSYTYKVSAIDAAGNESSQSSSVSATTQAAAIEGTILFKEGFEDTNFSSRGWYDQTNFVTSTAEYIPGSTRSAAFVFNSGATKPTSGGSIRKLFTESDSVYISYWVKYASNWKEQSGGLHHEIHLLTNQDSEYSGLAFTHLTAYLEHWGTYNQSVSLKPDISFQDGVNIDQTKINVNLTSVTENRSTSGCNGAGDSYATTCYDAGGGSYYNGKTIPGTAGSLSIGAWHHVEAYIKLNSIVSNKGVTDGIVAYWLDGVKQFQHNDVMMRTGQYPNMKFNQFVIAPYMGNGSPQTQTFWIDDLTVSTSPPGTSSVSAPTVSITVVNPN